MKLVAIGTVESPLTDRASAPKQGDEGAPEAWLAFEPAFADALDGIAAGDELLVLTWLDRARRAARTSARRPEPRAAGRLQHPLARPAEPDRPAPGDRRGDRRHADAGPRARGARRHPDRRRQAALRAVDER